MPVPEVLIVAPPPARTPKGTIAPKFEGADAKSKGLAEAFADVATELGCPFFDAGRIVRVSAIDGVHLDADQHLVLGLALAKEVAALLDRAA
jgi:lysophospholipase L1-like esterase